MPSVQENVQQHAQQRNMASTWWSEGKGRSIQRARVLRVLQVWQDRVAAELAAASMQRQDGTPVFSQSQVNATLRQATADTTHATADAFHEKPSTHRFSYACIRKSVHEKANHARCRMHGSSSCCWQREEHTREQLSAANAFSGRPPVSRGIQVSKFRAPWAYRAA